MNEDPSQFLNELGWNPFFQEHFQLIKVPGSVPGRVVSESKGSYQVNRQYGELTATITGKMRYQAEGQKTYPAVGDWVVIKPLVSENKAIINAVLPRKSKSSMKIYLNMIL